MKTPHPGRTRDPPDCVYKRTQLAATLLLISVNYFRVPEKVNTDRFLHFLVRKVLVLTQAKHKKHISESGYSLEGHPRAKLYTGHVIV